MSELSSKQRILRVLNRQEPDRVPHFEWVVDKKVRAALLPGCTSNNDFAVRMGQDAVTSEPDFKNEQIAPGKWRTEWGYVVQHSDEDHGVESNPPIRTLEDLDRYVAPDPCATGRYASIEKTLAKYGEKKAVVVHLNDVFSIPRNLMGFENLLMAIAAEPELVRALVRLSVDINIAMAKEVASRGVKIVFTGDDYAGDSGPLMSPAHFQDLFADSLRQLVQGFKSLGLMVIKHTDGMLWPIIDPIVDSGIDCLDPIDPLAGMKLGEVKRRFGARIALKGNVDCAHLMTLGTPAQVEEATKEALREGAEGGGFILSSSNSIHSAVKPENYIALLKTVEKYGKYPVKV